MRLLAVLALIPFAMLGARAHAAEAAIAGTGATFPAKVYQQWADQYARDTGVKVSYLPTGSSAGVKQIVAQAVDFGATDVPLRAADLEKHQLFQFPTLVGGVVPVVNLPGIPSTTLRLTGEVLAAIFSGRIERWNDRAIVALNPGLALPDLRITRVVRADGSGTTEVFVSYLKQSAAAAAAPIEAQGGRAKWPGATVAMEGSGKLAQAVKATPGSIGYISSDYVVREGLMAASLQNRRGEWIAPGLDAYRASIRAGALFKASLDATPLIDIDGVGVWPIVTATYIVVPRAPASIDRAGRTLNFFYRSFLLGDQAVAGTGFAPLPVVTQARIVALLSGFRTPDGRQVPVMGDATKTTTRVATARIDGAPD